MSGNLTARRGIIFGADLREDVVCTTAEVPLAETFGYATDLRSLTQGRGVFTMELSRYRKVPMSIQEEIVAERRKSELVGAK